MKALITARYDSQSIDRQLGASSVDGIVTLPDDTISFLRIVLPFGRFEITAPTNGDDVWLIDFQNEYD